MLFRISIGTLTLCCVAVAAVPLRPAGAAELAPEQRREIESIIHDYLLQHPDVLIEAIRAAEEKVRTRSFQSWARCPLRLPAPRWRRIVRANTRHFTTR